MPKYILLKRAENDLAEIANYGIEKWGYEQSLTYRDSLKSKLQEITNAPLRYPSIDHIRKGYRQCVFSWKKSRVTIYYRIKGKNIEIIRLIGRQNF